MEDKALDIAIMEYYNLKQQKTQIDARLNDLNDKIKRGMAEREMVKEDGENAYDIAGLRAKITVKKKHTIDENALWDTLFFRDRHEDYCELTFRNNAAEEAYLNGDINDTDLRRIKTTDYQLSLEVKNVQS